MDSKRKANGAAASESEDRSSKRRKVADFDLSKGETPESTTAYGLAFLEQIRRTADKNGRPVASYFEKLIPRQGNAEYYKQTRMPLSLEIIEAKLNKGGFRNLAELESYFKRMISNAKEFYPRGSPVFDDAERIRKATSNYMTKTNPAYNNRKYQALPAPIPAEEAGEAGQEAEEEQNQGRNGDADPDEDDEDGDEEEDKDAEAEEHHKDEPRPEPEPEPEEEEEPARRGRSIILKRSRPARGSRTSTSQVQESPRASAPPTRPDHKYEGVPYKGLNFQQAQEKIVEEAIRYQPPDYDDAYYEPFINLPPRALKDYYRIVTEPLALRKLQKMVHGIQGRNDVSGVSEFKTWAAFEDKAKLLWTNAYFYNEEDSDIYALAKELERFFTGQIKSAKAVVPEPTQSKIKLRVGQAPVDTPTTSKKITIHVGGRGGSADTPTPQAAQAAQTPARAAELPARGQDTNGTARSSITSHIQPVTQLDKVQSVAAAVPSPRPSMQTGLKVEDAPKLSPSGSAQPPPSTALEQATPAARPSAQPSPLPPQQTQPPVHNLFEQKRLRREGKGLRDALISRLRIQLHPSVQGEAKSLISTLPHPKEMQQSATINVPATHTRVYIVPMIPEFLSDRQYSLWAMVDKQPLKASQQPIPGQLPHERVFDVMLHPGLNVVETHLIAAIPRSERLPGGPEVELEIFTVFVNVMRS
ncbi:hypothetical protein S7711_01232 [Stachybotrys chartarum IBT 7711]|uniref:Bromo domain-containing protein n=1 Tax=Stachybotrys chartarum (strain CBS 109288 / IBT 7711) TaxID=1280523 RepID=A0A084AT29_STACB|nr:hypothetical protein S7711_01232 [Stachybotrys chartarum IBT 7711]